MLIAFVVLYLLLTIAIGLWAAITTRAPEHAHAQH
jgi:hypothetical protein